MRRGFQSKPPAAGNFVARMKSKRIAQMGNQSLIWRMNAIAIWRGFRNARLNFFMLTAIFLAGCATHRIDWPARVGNYTYDQAVLELGPPDKHAELQDGTIVADWLTNRGRIYSYPAQYEGYPYWRPYSSAPTVVDSPDYYLRLTFGPDHELKSWRKFTR
jgi:hypothetical protein